jgi:ankyrin repeat protein
MFGVSVDIRGMRGQTPLHDTVGDSDADVVRFLLEHGTDANAQQVDLSTPLHLA